MTDTGRRALLRGGPFWCTLLWAAVLLPWAVIPPLFQAPDEPQHVDLILDAGRLGLDEWYAPGADEMGTAVERAGTLWLYADEAAVGADDSSDARRLPGVTADQAFPVEERPGYLELFRTDGTPSVRINQMTQHPPLHYRLAGLLVRATPGWDVMPFDRLVLLLRLLSVVWLLPLPYLMAALARTVLGADERLQTAAALSPLLIPQLAHLASVVSNDPPLIIFSTVALLQMARVVRGDHRLATAAILGAATMLALLSKGFALVLPPAIVLAYLVGFVRDHREGGSARAWLRPLLVAAVVTAPAGWWYVENLVAFGAIQPSVLPAPPADPRGTLVDYLVRAGAVLAQTFWGRVGWAEVGFDMTEGAVLTALALPVLVLGVRRTGLVGAVLLLPSVLVLVVSVVQAYAFFTADGMVRALQGRYVFLGVAGILIVVLAGADRALGLARRRWLPLVVLAVASLLQLIVVLRAVRFFYTDPEGGRGLADAVVSLVAWSPLPRWGLALLFVFGLLSFVGVLRSVVGLPAEAAAEEEQSEEEQQEVAAT